MRYSHIEVKPVAGALGAEIFGVDLAKPIDGATFAEIHRAHLDYLVVFFRDQEITDEELAPISAGVSANWRRCRRIASFPVSFPSCW